MKAPFVYFGGKSRIAPEVWKALGQPAHYLEPFFGSGAVLLARKNYDPKKHTETICDADGHICCAPGTRILKSDLRYVGIETLKAGDRLLAFDEFNDGPRFKCAPSGYRHWRVATVLSTKAIMRPSVRLTFNDGTVVVCSEEHQWLSGSNRGLRWVTTKNWYTTIPRANQHAWVFKPLPVIEPRDDYIHGWLGGFADGEGHYHGGAMGGGGSWAISLHQLSGPIADKAVASLEKCGYKASRHVKLRPGRKSIEAITILGGADETFRFLMECRPERLITNFLNGIEKKSIYTRRGRSRVFVTKMEPLGNRKVIALTTSTGTYIAEGLASHNCNVWRSIQADPDEVAKYCDYPVNHCVPAGTSISTPNGDVPVESIKKGMIVYGLDGERIIPTEVLGTTLSETSDPLVRVGPLDLTGNHPVWTADGYVEAQNFNLPVDESDLFLLDYEHEGKGVGNLCSYRSAHRRDSICRSDMSFQCNQAGYLSLNEKRIPVHGVSFQTPLTVYNFQTTTGNYFANRVLVHNCDLIARRGALNAASGVLLEKLCADETFFDARLAGYWVWGASCSIGNGMSGKNEGRPALKERARGVQSADLSMDEGKPIQEKKEGKASKSRPHLTSKGQGSNSGSKSIPHLGGGSGVHAKSKRASREEGKEELAAPFNISIYHWLRRLSERLRNVRVVCGDWSRICGGNWQTSIGKCGIFFDPPYGEMAQRTGGIYNVDSLTVAADVQAWCKTHGNNPDMRIVLAGYSEEHQALLAEGWREISWVAQGGYANQGKRGGKNKENRFKESLFLNPSCRDLKYGLL